MRQHHIETSTASDVRLYFLKPPSVKKRRFMTVKEVDKLIRSTYGCSSEVIYATTRRGHPHVTRTTSHWKEFHKARMWKQKKWHPFLVRRAGRQRYSSRRRTIMHVLMLFDSIHNSTAAKLLQ